MERSIQLTISRVALPRDIHGVIMTTGGGDACTIFVNQQETETQQAAAFLHECLHLFYDDLNGGEVNTIEATRHAELIDLLEILRQRVDE